MLKRIFIFSVFLLFSWNCFAVVQVSGLKDFSFKNLKRGDSGKTMNENLCVYSSTGDYKLKITGTGDNGAFTLIALPDHQKIRYQVFWNDKPSTEGNTHIEATKTYAFTNASLEPTCANGLSANIQITIPTSQIHNLQHSHYIGSLTVDVNN